MIDAVLRFFLTATLLLTVGLLGRYFAQRKGPLWTASILRATVAAVFLAALFHLFPLPVRETPLQVLSKPILPASTMPSVMRSQTVRITGSTKTLLATKPVPAEVAVPPDWQGIAFMSYIGGTVLCVILLLCAWGNLVRLRLHSTRLPDDRDEVLLLRQIAANLGVRAPELRELPAGEGPFLAVVPAPVLFLPMMTRFQPLELRAVFAHELTHLKRSDLAWFALARCLQAVLWFHPLVYLLSRQLEQAAEEICDEASVAGGVPAVTYADFLLKLSEYSATPALGTGIAPFRSSVGKRIARLLQADRPSGYLSTWMQGLITGIAISLVVISIAVIGTTASRPGGSSDTGETASRSPLIPTVGRASTTIANDLARTRLPAEVLYTRLQRSFRIEVAQPQPIHLLVENLLAAARVPYHIEGNIQGNLPAGWKKNDRVLELLNALGQEASPRFFAATESDENNQYRVEIVPLPPVGGITGLLVYPDGRPAAGWYVTAQICNVDMFLPVRSNGAVRNLAAEALWGGHTRTDANGVYRFTNLGPFHYNVAVDPDDPMRPGPLLQPGKPFIAPALEGVPVVSNKIQTCPTIRLVSGGIIEGVLRDKSGRLLPGVYIGSHGPHRPETSAMVISTETDAEGRYRLRVAPGTSLVYVGHQGYKYIGVRVTVGDKERRTVNLVTERTSPEAASGQKVTEEERKPEVETNAQHDSPAMRREEFHQKLGKPVTVQWENVPVREGMKQLLAAAEIPYRLDEKISGQVSISLKNVPLYQAIREIGKVASPRFGTVGRNGMLHVQLMPPTGSIRGRVLYPDGKPASKVYVLTQIQNQIMSEPADLVGGDIIQTDENGYYRTDELGAYPYNVAVALNDPISQIPQPEAFVAAALEGIKGKPGETQTMPDIRLTAGAVVTGTVRGRAGQPIKDVWIGSYGPHRPESSAMIIGTRTDTDGRFQLRLAPGSSRIYISDGRYKSEPQTVTLKEGATGDLSFSVEERTPDS